MTKTSKTTRKAIRQVLKASRSHNQSNGAALAELDQIESYIEDCPLFGDRETALPPSVDGEPGSNQATIKEAN
ncbi:MAG: hypothetical protein AAFX93_19830 [Verrucomicrobiota bacterium]